MLAILFKQRDLYFFCNSYNPPQPGMRYRFLGAGGKDPQHWKSQSASGDRFSMTELNICIWRWFS